MRPVTQFDEGWEHIEKGIRKVKRIVEGLPGPKFNAEEYMLLYTTVFNMCTQNPPHHYSHQLYDKYKEVFVEYNTSIVLPFLTKQQHDHEFMLRNFVKRWEAHKVMVRWLSRFFDYLERFFVPRRSLPGLNEVGLACFRDFVYPQVKVRARAAVLGLLNKVREGEQIDSALLKNVIHVFVDIGEKDVYQDLKAHILEDRGFEYYSGQASSWISKGISDPDYMLKAEECLKRERDIVCPCLLTSSDQQKLVEKVEHVLLEPLVNRFKQHVTAQVPILAKQVEDIAASNKASNGPGMPEEVLVEKLIELLDKYIPHVNGCFKDYYAFHNVLKVAFDAFFNKSFGGSSSVELLATFCDNVLKKGGSHEKLSDEAIEETLEKVVKLLPYIRDKDLFAEFYRKRLARRLLFDRSANKDNEKSMLKKMKQQCGRYFTSKMEGMVTDLTLAQDNQTGFEEYIRSNPNVNPGMDLRVTVLTSGFWPSYKSFDLKLPAEMVKCVEDFKGFYETKTAHRKLTWVNSLGTCNIIGNFEPKKIELVLPTFQAALLLLFNTADRLNYSEILTQLNVTHENLVRILHSLSCAKYKILIKDPNTKTISPKDNFEFNSKFTDRKRKIKIPLPPVDQRKEVIQDVDKDRRYAIDAAIVRIMKSQKVLLHQQLVMECIKQLTHMFKPDIKLIKKRIEDLITRDYLERDKNNLNMFKYIA